MTLLFGFKLLVRTSANVVTLIRCDHATTVLIILLLIFKNVFYLEKSVLSCVIFHLKLLCLYDFSGLQILT